jgi:hypothetical protein
LVGLRLESLLSSQLRELISAGAPFAPGRAASGRFGQVAANEQSVDCDWDCGGWRETSRQRQRVGGHPSSAEVYGVITAGLAVVGAAQGAAEGAGDAGRNDLEPVGLREVWLRCRHEHNR